MSFSRSNTDFEIKLLSFCSHLVHFILFYFFFGYFVFATKKNKILCRFLFSIHFAVSLFSLASVFFFRSFNSFVYSLVLLDLSPSELSSSSSSQSSYIDGAPTLHLIAYSVNQKGRSEPTVLEDIAINEAEKRTGTLFCDNILQDHFFFFSFFVFVFHSCLFYR